MYIVENKQLKIALSLGLLLILCAGLFGYTITVRKASFGVANTIETWFSSGTLISAKNWYRENPFALRFGMYLNPKSIEFPDRGSRIAYTSFPPGAILPIYVAGLLTGHEPTLSLLMAYNLLNHFLIAALLSAMVFLLLADAGIGYVNAFLFGCVPLVLDLLLPAPLYHHQMGFFADQAIILPFVLFVFLELLRERSVSVRWRRFFSVVQGLLLLYGALTDWLFSFVALCVYVKRLFKWELGRTVRGFFLNSFLYWFPFVVGLGLFALQLWLLNGFGNISRKFEAQTGMMGGQMLSVNPSLFFWTGHMVRGFGKPGVALVLGSGALWALLLIYIGIRVVLRRKNPPALAGPFRLGFLLLVPCLLFTLFLNAYSGNPFHYFGVLKYSVPLAVVPFALAPVALLASVNAGAFLFSPRWILGLFVRRWRGVRTGFSLLPIIMLGLAIGYVYFEWPRVQPQFRPMIPNPNRVEYASFLDKNLGFNDVVFTVDSSLEQNVSPLWLAYSMKRVYICQSLQDIFDKVSAIQGEYIIDFLSKPSGFAPKKPDVDVLRGKAYEWLHFRDWTVERMHKQDFLEVCRQQGVKGAGA